MRCWNAVGSIYFSQFKFIQIGLVLSVILELFPEETITRLLNIDYHCYDNNSYYAGGDSKHNFLPVWHCVRIVPVNALEFSTQRLNCHLCHFGDVSS